METPEGWIRLEPETEVPVKTEVLIPKEVAWKSTHPTEDSGVTKRDTRLKVQTSSSKWSPELTWAGTAGYWKRCPKTECFVRKPVPETL
jgi:hypothetical protein